MLVRLLIALLASPWYGLLAVLATLPVLIVGSVLIGLIASVVPQQTALEGSVNVAVVIIIISVIVGLLSVLLQVLVHVQMVRYAGAFSGTIRLGKQPRFLKSYLRGLGVMILFGIFFIVLTIIVVAVVSEIWDPLDLPAMSPGEIRDWSERLTGYFLTGGQTDAESDVLGWAVLSIRGLGMLYTTLLALVLVPIVCGISSESGASWTLGYVLFRIFVAIPCCALMTAILVELIIVGIELFTGAWALPTRLLFVLTVEGMLFAGVIYALEAMLLRSGHEVAVEERQMKTLDEMRDPDDYRSLRKQRTGGY